MALHSTQAVAETRISLPPRLVWHWPAVSGARGLSGPHAPSPRLWPAVSYKLAAAHGRMLLRRNLPGRSLGAEKARHLGSEARVSGLPGFPVHPVRAPGPGVRFSGGCSRRSLWAPASGWGKTRAQGRSSAWSPHHPSHVVRPRAHGEKESRAQKPR